MEYFRDPKNQIYADLAYRIGRIVVQYENMETDENKFEATLYLIALQSLMTNCNEYVRQMTRSTRRQSIFKKPIAFSNWGIDANCWVTNTFREESNLQVFIQRIRNSISHPTQVTISEKFPSTGYTTLLDDSGIIHKFRFINSPDTTKNRLKEFDTEEIVRRHIDRTLDEMPEDIAFRKKTNGKYILMSNSREFARISIIDLTVKQIGSFVKNLANYLAQPIQDNWDGVTIKEIIAA